MADAIFGFGTTGDVNFGYNSITNLVDNNGTVAANQSALTGTPRSGLAAARFGVDQAIFGFGIGGPLSVSITNLVTNLGVVATDTTGVGTPRSGIAAAGYGGDKAIFGYGLDDFAFSEVSITNLVSNLGVVTADQTALTGTPRMELAAAGYGGDKAIFGFGGEQNATIYYSITNLVSATGIVASNTTGVGTARSSLAAAGFGGDQAIFGYGYNDPTFYSLTNKVSNTGIVATDTTGVGTARFGLAAAGYGGDKAIFGFGATVIGPAYTNLSMTNLVNNLGVVATDTSGVGTARSGLAAAGLSSVSPTTTTTTTSAPGLTTTTTTAAPTKIQYTLTNTGTGSLTIQSMTFNDPPGVGHIANLVNLGGSSTETGNASLSQLLDPGITKTFTLDYTNTGAGAGTYLGNVIISGSNSTGQTINSTITVVSGTTTTTTLAPGLTTTTTTAAPGTTTTTTAAPGTTTTTSTTTASPGTLDFSPAPSGSNYAYENPAGAEFNPYIPTASASIRLDFTNQGVVSIFDATGDTPTVNDLPIQWFTPTGGGIGGSYDIRITSMTGTCTAGSRSNWTIFGGVVPAPQNNPSALSVPTSWQPLDFTQSVIVAIGSSPIPSATTALTFTVEIADRATHTTTTTGVFTLVIGGAA